MKVQSWVAARSLGIVAMTLVLFAVPLSVHAQAGPPVRVTWTPERPVHGTLFRIRATPLTDFDTISGTVIGEPLHFRTVAEGQLEALAAVPLDHGRFLDVALKVVRAAGAVDTVNLRIPIGEGSYTLERLTVAPRFGAPPDPVTAARMARERERALAVSRASHATPRLWDQVVAPRESRITSRFGSGREFNGRVQSRHTGTDFAGEVGAPVHSAARGVVALVDTFYLAGRVIYLDHGAGLVSGYFHLSRQDVAVGDTVDAGQTIGRVGATGRVTGPHLHWLLRYGAITVDPLSLIDISR